MAARVKTPLLAAIACGLLIAPLAFAAYSLGAFQHLDLRIFLHLRREEGPVNALAGALVNLGDLAALLIMLAAVCVIGLRLGRRREVIAAAVVVAGANLTTQLLKTTLEHARHKAFEHGIELPWPNSFPSGHTTAAASIAAALLLVLPAGHRLVAGLVGLLLTAAVGFSVVILGWHYPSDVLGGLLVVGAWGFAALAWLRRRGGRDRAPTTQEHRRPRHLAVSTD
ncbi:MAG TPA: phosphatase PAP2 family protein [Solirubrobacterales bacterium]|jgi:membrane-associated phospholipid phosphatase|nr:phosphatase PAP2 family protein [Solirubrobacterales bacterium]